MFSALLVQIASLRDWKAHYQTMHR